MKPILTIKKFINIEEFIPLSENYIIEDYIDLEEDGYFISYLPAPPPALPGKAGAKGWGGADGIVYIGKLKRLLIVRVQPLEVRLLSIPNYYFTLCLGREKNRSNDLFKYLKFNSGNCPTIYL